MCQFGSILQINLQPSPALFQKSIIHVPEYFFAGKGWNEASRPSRDHNHSHVIKIAISSLTFECSLIIFSFNDIGSVA